MNSRKEMTTKMGECKGILKIAAVVVLVATCQAPSLAQSGPPGWEQANALFQAQNYAEAAKAFEKIAEADPSNGRAWFRLGLSFHSGGDYKRAVEAYQKAAAIGTNPLVMYNLGCSYARLNQKDQAFEWLNNAFSAGFAQLASLKSDEDLAGLRSDARFSTLLASAANLLTPCEVRPEYKQFDFWVGEWDVMNPQGQRVGTNSVQRIVSGCIIFENWTSGQGSTGKSFNFYAASDRKWHQVWVDSSGSALDLAGEYRDGAMRYEGVTVGQDGNKRLEKLTFFNLSPGRVRQFWEQSTDQGKTWVAAFDGTYIRKNVQTGK
jgi:tetratricopeptide (TPR) repeat protein